MINEIWGISNFLELKGRLENDFDNLCNTFQNYLARLFEDSPQINITKFFKIYAFIQELTKPQLINNQFSYYKRGTKRIVAKYIEENVKTLQILSGPSIRDNLTYNRLYGMLSAFEDIRINHSDDFDLKIRLTLINTPNGYRNVSTSSLSYIFYLIDSDPILENFISGFDFSGFESPKFNGQIFEFIKQISEYNRERRKKSKKTFPISVHAGENTFLPIMYQFNFIDKLLNNKIDTLCHGTLLWIPNNCVKGISKFNRDIILEKIKINNCQIEVCPTANLKFSQMKILNKVDISLLRKFDIPYTINTDNRTIFNTSLVHERKLVYWK